MLCPVSRYPELTGFTEANTAYVDVAVDLGEKAVRSALDAAHLTPADADAIVMVSSTGVAVPTVDARVASRIGLRPDVKRIPLFGLGCVAGAAGMAPVHDYLRGFPGDVAVLLSVELCSLTMQRDDMSVPALIGVCLFGDGAAAVVATGADRVPTSPTAPAGPAVLATRSRLFPDTFDVMGWDVSSSGFGLVMSRDVPPDVRRLPGRGGRDLPRRPRPHHQGHLDLNLHPGGPRVLDSIEHAVGLPPEATMHSRESMRQNGNISSASVLDVLHRTLESPPPDGSLGVMLAMGPGFSFELLLLGW